MKTPVDRTQASVLLALGALCAGLYWWQPWASTAGSDSLGVSRETAANDRAPGEALVQSGALALDSGGDPAALGRREAGEPSAAESAAEGSQQESELALPFQPLHGVVLDPRGRPVPGVQVSYRAQASPKGSFGSENLGEPRVQSPMLTAPSLGGKGRAPSTPGPGGRPGADFFGNFPASSDRNFADSTSEVSTDAQGAFEFPEISGYEPGELHFGQNVFSGTVPSQAVIPDGVEQSLFLPARPAGTPLVRIHLSDSESGKELLADVIEARLKQLPKLPALDDQGNALPRRALMRPAPEHIQSGLGWIELSLWPGTWNVQVATRESGTEQVTFEVPRSGPIVEIDLELRVFDPGRGWDALAPVVDGALEPWPDPSSGFDLHGKDTSPLRRIGERRSDRSFRHTLEFGPGELSAAYLELDLEAASGMAYNDSIGLEFYEGPRFAYSNRISVFTGGNWRSPARRRLLIDLSNLPGKGGPVSVLPDMADGRLDVYIQDDTAVHDVRLFVQR